MNNQIQSVRLWHITPVDIGFSFSDPTVSSLEGDSEFYNIVNSAELNISRKDYSKSDYSSIETARDYLTGVKDSLSQKEIAEKLPYVRFEEKYPGVVGCISQFIIDDNLSCYIMMNGTAVFFEKGEKIPFDDERYFSIPVFYERQVVEDDYCNNPEKTRRKKQVYDFINVLWDCVNVKKTRGSSSSRSFRNNGISYTLCITAVDIPGFLSTDISETLRKNIYAMLDTSAFNNIMNRERWESIKSRIDCDDISTLDISKMSENLIMSDNWSGVVIAGDLQKNSTCLEWFVEFEIYLQSMWLLFDAYGENIKHQNYSSIELQKISNVVEYYKVQLANDISSNMEQSRHKMRQSLIETSDIKTIFRNMQGTLQNRLKLNMLYDEKKRGKFAFLSDVALLIIAIMQIYGVINSLISADSFGTADIVSLCITAVIAVVCIWIMAKGRFS